MTSGEVVENLKVQCHRLQGALDRFYGHQMTDDGTVLVAEAVNIATPMRVMIHQSKHSHALLRQFDSDYLDRPIHFAPLLAPRPTVLPSGLTTMTRVVPVNAVLSTDGTQFFKRYQAGSDSQHVAPIGRWWISDRWDSGSNTVSNKDLVLSLANKEGGAHFDSKIDENYAKAKAQGRIQIAGKQVDDVARIGSLVGIAGDELLESIRRNYDIL